MKPSAGLLGLTELRVCPSGPCRRSGPHPASLERCGLRVLSGIDIRAAYTCGFFFRSISATESVPCHGSTWVTCLQSGQADLQCMLEWTASVPLFEGTPS